MSKKCILFISGIADRSELEIKSIDSNGNYIFHLDGNFNLFDYLPTTNFKKTYLVLDTKAEQDITLPRLDAIFNQIGNADTHKVTLSKIDTLYKTIENKLPFFNIPTNIEKTSKTQIHPLLNKIEGLEIPKTVQFIPFSPNDIYHTIEKKGFSLPVIIQASYDETIRPILIMDGNNTFKELALNGQEYYLTQFIPYKLNEYYRKERLAVINGEVFMVDAQFSDSWHIDDNSKIIDAETNIMRHSIANRFETEIKPIIQPAITEIYHRVNLDYFTIDCHIDQKKKIHLFQFNPDADIFAVNKNHPFTKQLVQAHSKLIQTIEKKL